MPALLVRLALVLGFLAATYYAYVLLSRASVWGMWGKSHVRDKHPAVSAQPEPDWRVREARASLLASEGLAISDEHKELK